MQEGRDITPNDPEEFLLKQEFVRRIGEKTSLKAEEESVTTTAMTSAPLDFVSKLLSQLYIYCCYSSQMEQSM